MTVKLTPGQERLLPYIIEGLPYAAIAERVGLSVGRVKNQVYMIAMKIPPAPYVPTFRRVQLWALARQSTPQSSHD